MSLSIDFLIAIYFAFLFSGYTFVVSRYQAEAKSWLFSIFWNLVYDNTKCNAGKNLCFNWGEIVFAINFSCTATSDFFSELCWGKAMVA